MKTPTLKARALLVKLQALADRGIDGEKSTAKRKLAQLKAKYDFALADAENKDDIFSGRYQTKRGATVRIATIAEVEIGNFVKWAIESATGVAPPGSNGPVVVSHPHVPEPVPRCTVVAAGQAPSTNGMQ